MRRASSAATPGLTGQARGGVFARSILAIGAVVGLGALTVGAASPALATELVDLASPGAPVIASTPIIETRPGGGVRLSLPLSQSVETQVFPLVDPDRLVVDFPELDWRFVGKAPNFDAAEGVHGMRVGLFRPGRSRLVIDLDGAARVLDQQVRQTADGAVFTLDFMVAMETADIGSLDSAAEIARAAAATLRSTGAPMKANRPMRRPSSLIIAVDAGHGGHDAGAVYNGQVEKELVLKVARTLKHELEQMRVSGRKIDVVMTRDSDVFISLDERVLKAREAGAELFISLHANAFERDRRISGAGVYTLSEVASDSLTSRLARRENASDAIAGVPMAGVDDTVRKILVDFRRRRMMDESHFLAKRLVSELKTRVRLERKNPHRHANFRVLRNFDMPSVLIELGYLTNIEDRRAMENPAWREAAAEAIAESVKKWIGQERGAIREASLR